MGCLVQEVFSGRRLTRTEDLRDLARIPLVCGSHIHAQTVCSPAVAAHGTTSQLLSSGCIQSSGRAFALPVSAVIFERAETTQLRQKAFTAALER
jgi:hypothetical protein